MLSRSTANACWDRTVGAGQALIVLLTATALSLSAGAVATLSRWIPLMGLAGMAGLGVTLWLALGPTYLTLGSALMVRGLTDAFSDFAIVAGLNAGALIGLMLTAVLMLTVLLRRAVRGLMLGLILMGLVAYWFALGVIQHGTAPSLVRELVRSSSIVAVALIAANGDRRGLTPARLATMVVVASLLPALLVIAEAVGRWPEMVEGTVRPRGSMSHANAASILFGIALPIAAWRWAYGGGGRYYLGAMLVFAAASLLTLSIGGLVQAVVTLLAFASLQQGNGRYRLGIGVIAAVIISMFLFDPLGISRVDEIESTSLAAAETGRANNSFEWRLLNWKALIEEWQGQPDVGLGLGATSDLVNPLGHLPHSDPVRVLVETGAVGFILAAGAYIVVVNRLLLLWRRGPHPSFTGAVLAVLIGVSVHALVTHVSFNTQAMYVLAALLGWTLSQPLTPLGIPASRRDDRPAKPRQTGF